MIAAQTIRIFETSIGAIPAPDIAGALLSRPLIWSCRSGGGPSLLPSLRLVIGGRDQRAGKGFIATSPPAISNMTGQTCCTFHGCCLQGYSEVTKPKAGGQTQLQLPPAASPDIVSVIVRCKQGSFINKAHS
jgi:hypothetical protein